MAPCRRAGRQRRHRVDREPRHRRRRRRFLALGRRDRGHRRAHCRRDVDGSRRVHLREFAARRGGSRYPGRDRSDRAAPPRRAARAREDLRRPRGGARARASRRRTAHGARRSRRARARRARYHRDRAGAPVPSIVDVGDRVHERRNPAAARDHVVSHERADRGDGRRRDRGAARPRRARRVRGRRAAEARGGACRCLVVGRDGTDVCCRLLRRPEHLCYPSIRRSSARYRSQFRWYSRAGCST